MKNSNVIVKCAFLMFFLSGMLTKITGQDTCFGSSDNGGQRSSFSCPDLDELSAEEVQAMPILYIPVVFHFKAYHDNVANIDVNFTCDPNDPLVFDDPNDPSDYANPILYAPTFVYRVMSEMNNRMSDQLNEDPLYDQGLDLVYADTRIRYYLLNGPDWTTLISDPDCSSFNFYDKNSTISGLTTTLSKDAIHIIYTDENGDANGGAAFPSDMLQLNNIEERNYCRSIFRGPEFNNTWGTGRNINHEVAHLFGLDHTYNCENVCRKSPSFPNNPIDPLDHCCNRCWYHNGNPPSDLDPPCNGLDCLPNKWTTFGNTFLMNPSQFLTLTLCEHRVWWSNRTNNPFDFSDYCNTESEVEELVYDTGTKLIWSGLRMVNADIIIKSGTEVELTCDLFMGQNKRIIVERGARFHINGGSIQGLCNNMWQGIIVEGVSDPELLAAMGYRGQLNTYDDALNENKAGTIVMTNNATISHARTAISTYNDHYTYPEIQDYFGGLIYADNSNFIDCDRAVEFMRYGFHNIADKSMFLDCNFTDLGRGVTLWANNGVIFDNCTFDHCGTKAIQSFDSQIKVINGCDFSSNLDAIQLLNTSLNPYGHIIGDILTDPNTFENNHYAIYGNSQSSIKRSNIHNNYIIDNSYGIFFGGISNINIRGNYFEDSYLGVELVGTSIYDNKITSNKFDDNLIGLSYVNKNEGSTFTHNCFVQIDNYDVVLNNTTIFPTQGTSSVSAGNCFTKSSIPSIYCNTNWDPTTYFSFGSAASCYSPNISNC